MSMPTKHTIAKHLNWEIGQYTSMFMSTKHSIAKYSEKNIRYGDFSQNLSNIATFFLSFFFGTFYLF